MGGIEIEAVILLRSVGKGRIVRNGHVSKRRVWEHVLALAVRKAGGHYWGPNYLDLTESRVQNAHRMGLEVHTWTANEPTDIARLSRWGVDGVTSDYPDRARTALGCLGVTLPSPIVGTSATRG